MSDLIGMWMPGSDEAEKGSDAPWEEQEGDDSMKICEWNHLKMDTR